MGCSLGMIIGSPMNALFDGEAKRRVAAAGAT
jgi:hypothetical protein